MLMYIFVIHFVVCLGGGGTVGGVKREYKGERSMDVPIIDFSDQRQCFLMTLKLSLFVVLKCCFSNPWPVTRLLPQKPSVVIYRD